MALIKGKGHNDGGAPLDVALVNGSSEAVGTPIAGTNGGLFTINADGAFDFDANGEFDDLEEGETRTTEAEYAISFVGTGSKVDIVLLEDLSGSFRDDLANLQSQFIELNDILSADKDVAYGVASFVDKPYSPFGGPSDYVYQTDLAITEDPAEVLAAIDSLTIQSGGDFPEAQIEALLQAALKSDSEIGFREGAQRIVVLSTDAAFHAAGDYADAPDGPNDADEIIENEDYPSIEQLKEALEANNIVPIFSVTSNVLSDYETLVEQLGRGTVVTQSSSSTDLSEAVIEALSSVETFDTATVRVEVEGTSSGPECVGNEIIGTDGKDHLTGTFGDDCMDGLAGNDKIFGLFGSDTIFGGDGKDKLFGGFGDDFVYGGANRDQIFGGLGSDNLYGGDGNDKLWGSIGDDHLTGGLGNDRLTGGLGKDGFYFSGDWGKDTIQDFGVGHDKLYFSEDDIQSIDDLSISTKGRDTLIKFGDNEVRLKGVRNFRESDIEFTDFSEHEDHAGMTHKDASLGGASLAALETASDVNGVSSQQDSAASFADLGEDDDEFDILSPQFLADEFA